MERSAKGRETNVSRFKSILFVDDGRREQEQPLDRAVSLAQRHEALLTVAGTLDGLPREMRQLGTVLTTESLADLAAEERMERLERMVAPIRLEGNRVVTRVLIGEPVAKILAEIAENRHDLVMLPAPKRGLRELLFGSMVTQLMGACPCPVWVYKLEAQPRMMRVLAAVNPGYDGEDHSEMNARILETAAALAGAGSGELHVVYAWTLTAESVLRGRAGLRADQIAELVHQGRLRAAGQVDLLLNRPCLRDARIRVHLRRGNAVSAIARLARKQRIGVVVLGNNGRRGVARLLAGSTAEAVLREAPCSVVTVRGQPALVKNHSRAA
jgi:universal stress protein E